jgi:DUF1680 family protein
MEEIAARTVKIEDPFWTSRLAVNTRRAIFHQWEQLEASGCIDNFRILAGLKQGFREGWFFADSDAYKWLEAAACIYAIQPDAHLAALMDELVGLLEQCQAPDGYLFTYNQIHFPDQRWVALQIEHELYCLGHLIEAGVVHYTATGSRRLLDVVVKAADLLVRDMLNTRPEHTCGHEEIELALLRLHRLTGNASYLELARQFLERRGRIPLFPLHLYRQFNEHERRSAHINQLHQAYATEHPEYNLSRVPPGNYAKPAPHGKLRWYLNALSGKYMQQHAPLRRQKTPVGHSVRFGYLETAAAMLCRQQPDAGLRQALEQSWERMVTRRMYVTGGLGSLSFNEGDYELDPELAYAETCAALASLFWNWEMALLTREAKYSDLFEWQLYNASAVGMGLSGESYLYNNPLVSRGGISRKPWFAVPCCPSNLSRTWASLGRYVFSQEGDAIWVHQLIGSQAEFQLRQPVRLQVHSGLPWQGSVTLRVEPAAPLEFTLHLRIPSWAAEGPSPDLTLNGNPLPLPSPLSPAQATAGGYDPRRAQFIPLTRLWSPGDRLVLHLPLPIRALHPHPRLKGHAGKATLARGPLVYCLESVDNPGVDLFTAHVDLASLQAAFEPELLGGIHSLRGQTNAGQPITAIPYALWGNRGESQMTVYIHTT